MSEDLEQRIVKVKEALLNGKTNLVLEEDANLVVAVVDNLMEELYKKLVDLQREEQITTAKLNYLENIKKLLALKNVLKEVEKK